MSRNLENGSWTAPLDALNGNKKPTSNQTERTSASVRGKSVDSAERAALASLSRSLGGLVRDDPRVVAALEKYLQCLSSGCSVSREEFLAEHSEIADALGQCLSGLEFIHVAGMQLGGLQPNSSVHLADNVSPRARLGDYRILREIGRGGMGVVYEAEQVSLGRHVALKVLPFAAAIDPKQRQRFQIEAQAAAQLHHPHIVPIFNVGCDHGIHYYAMQFVEGRSLDALLHDLRRDMDAPITESGFRSGVRPLNQNEKAASGETIPLTLGSVREHVRTGHCSFQADRDVLRQRQRCLDFKPGFFWYRRFVATFDDGGSMRQDRAFFRNITRLGVEAAEALDHAHGLGVLHRDIKPANLLIDRDEALWITDFGLARFPSDLSLTHTGDMVGTLRYMSPEQALARRGVVDQRTDVYSLGVTLYELLTLRPAFDGRDHQELLRQIALDEPPKPRRINPAIPRDLETIVMKAMAKDPSGRYTTAQELAADLKRFLDDRPILARRPGRVEQSLRWAMRHRELVATTLAIFVLALIVSTAAIWAQARKTETANNSLQDANRKHNVYIIETWPLLDGFAMERMGQATKMMSGQTDPAIRAELMETYRHALKVYSHASQLPPADLESQAIIAKAYNRMGLTNAFLSKAMEDKNGPEPTLLSQSESDYSKSLVLFEDLYARFPTDPKVRRFYADALGSWGWLLLMTNRTEEAKPQYERAVELLREQIRDASAGTHGKIDNRAGESVTNVLGDLSSLASTVYTLASLLEAFGYAQAQATCEDSLMMTSTYLPRDSRTRNGGCFGRRSSCTPVRHLIDRTTCWVRQ